MAQPASWWTKVTLLDDTSNKYYVMLSSKDYERYSTDSDYAAKLLQQAKTQAIATALRQQELSGVGNESIESATQDLMNYQDVTCSSPQTMDERDIYKEDTNSYSDLANSEARWTFASTSLLVELVKQNFAGLNAPNQRKYVFWKKIHELMKEHNYDYEWQYLQKKWCNLLATYKKAKERQFLKAKSGRPMTTRWAYLEAFDVIYKNDPKISAVIDQNSNSSPVKVCILNNHGSSDFSTDSESCNVNDSEPLKHKRRKNSSNELKEILKLLKDKNEKENEALTILKNLAESTNQMEDRRTQAIENLTTCVTQLTDAIKQLVEKS